MTSSRPEYARIRLAFGASAYFRELPAASLDALASASTLERCHAGGLLHSAKEPVDKFWLVIEGGLLVSWFNPRGQAVPVAMIGAGSYYSAAALVEGAVLSNECRAERDTVLAALPGPKLRELVETDPALHALAPKLLLQRVQAALALYADSVSAPLPERLARRLLAQASATGLDPLRGEVELRTSQADLARMLGASRSKLNAELRRLEEAGILRLGYRRLHLIDCTRLSKIAGGHVPML